MRADFSDSLKLAMQVSSETPKAGFADPSIKIRSDAISHKCDQDSEKEREGGRLYWRPARGERMNER